MFMDDRITKIPCGDVYQDVIWCWWVGILSLKLSERIITLTRTVIIKLPTPVSPALFNVHVTLQIHFRSKSKCSLPWFSNIQESKGVGDRKMITNLMILELFYERSRILVYVICQTQKSLFTTFPNVEKILHIGPDYMSRAASVCRDDFQASITLGGPAWLME